MKTLKLFLILVAAIALEGHCADTNSATPAGSVAPANPASYSPAVLPGKGLAQHPFLYTGEWDHRGNRDQTMFVVRGGKVVWTYSIPIMVSGTLQELGDATMLSNGNIVFCRKIGASEITPDKKIIWNMDAPQGTEIHSIQPIGLDRVLVTENGNPAKLLLINIVTGKTEKEMTFPVLNPDKSPHIQFRRVHETPEGTYLAAHLRDNKVVEYDADFKEIWSYCRRSFKSGILCAFKSGRRFLGGNGRRERAARQGFGRWEDEAGPRSESWGEARWSRA